MKQGVTTRFSGLYIGSPCNAEAMQGLREVKCFMIRAELVIQCLLSSLVHDFVESVAGNRVMKGTRISDFVVRRIAAKRSRVSKDRGEILGDNSRALADTDVPQSQSGVPFLQLPKAIFDLRKPLRESALLLKHHGPQVLVGRTVQLEQQLSRLANFVLHRELMIDAVVAIHGSTLLPADIYGEAAPLTEVTDCVELSLQPFGC